MENDDLLTEIFLLLPAKTLIRFKSVSKKWRSLISSDYFCRRHTLLHPTPEPSLLLQTHVLQFFYMDDRTIYGGDEKRLIPYTLSDLTYHKIRHACNGLMLLESKVETTYDPITAQLRRMLKNSCYVYNPTTRKSREITLTHSDKYRYVEAMNLAFDPWKSPYYKIVCIRSTGPRVSPTDNPEHVYQIEVYDSERHSWKLSVEGLTSHNAAFHSNGVYWNDAVWWSCHGGHRCFDIGKGEVRRTSFPFRPHLGGWDHRNLYYIELVEEKKDGSEHYHRIRLALGDRSFRGQRIDRDVVRFVGGDGDGDGSCGLMTCREGKGRRAYRYIDKSMYENVVDLGHEWFDPVHGFPFPHILAVV